MCFKGSSKRLQGGGGVPSAYSKCSHMWVPSACSDEFSEMLEASFQGICSAFSENDSKELQMYPQSSEVEEDQGLFLLVGSSPGKWTKGLFARQL